jgi:hypothetical protein
MHCDEQSTALGELRRTAMIKILLAALAASAIGAPPLAAQGPADLDGDGRLDYFDLLELRRLYAAGDARADLDGDSQVDFIDLVAFQNEFAAGQPTPGSDFTFDGTLYNGMGSDASHMTEKANLEWGNTASNYVWLTQTDLGIRDVRHYKTGLGTHLFHIDFGWSAAGGPWLDCDVEPSGTPSTGWGYGGSTSHPDCTGTPTPLCHWIASGKDVVQDVIDLYETAYGSGSSNGLKVLFDNETIMDRGGKVGMGLRTGAWCENEFYGSRQRRELHRSV